MSGLMSRGAVLTASQLSNFAVMMMTPLLLVRILDVESYGQYQEFMIYAMLLVTICGFKIDSSLTYFLPRYPNQERLFLSQNSALVLALSGAFLAFLILARKPFLEMTSYDFVLPLASYVFCFVNLNWLEYYWIAKRRTDLVFYYSAARLLVRVLVLLVVAYVTRDVTTILWFLVGVEALRLLLVSTYLLRAGLLTTFFDPARVRKQLVFAGPVGLATLMQQSSKSVGKLFVGSALGPAALAYYAVASYMLPIVRTMIGSVSDVVFPELVRIRDDPGGALRLWQRSNVVFCVLLFPSFVLLNYYAELFISTLFTEKYLAAGPVLQVYALWLLRRCFNSDVLLRTRGRTGFMLTGSVLSIVINLALMVVLYKWIGLMGPAVAFISAEIFRESYNTTLVLREFRLSIAKLVDWGGVWRVSIGCLIGTPLLVAAEYLPGPELARAVFASVTYVAVCWLVAYRLGVADIGRILEFALSLVRKFAPSR